MFFTDLCILYVYLSVYTDVSWEHYNHFLYNSFFSAIQDIQTIFLFLESGFT